MGVLACLWSRSILAEPSPISSASTRPPEIRPGQEPDHASAPRAGHHRLPAQERHRSVRHRRADPRLDHRHQHADRAQRRQDRPGRHPRHPRRLHHRPRQPARGVQPPVPQAPAAGVARASPARSTSACWPPARCIMPLDRAERRGRLPDAGRRRRRGGRGLLPALLSRSGHERVAGDDDPRGAARRLSSRCRTKSCASTASSNAPRRRW